MQDGRVDGDEAATPDDPCGLRFPAEQAPGARSLADLDDRLTACRACPRLVAWRERVAAVKRRAFQDGCGSG